ncbi:hypothetical protein QJS10_CPA01g02323 [Acorus calamus]|uniref:Uncharacterized protein n=1 Tax=Acorus calamus TaxID=4465 RepID=A0AAV9FV94_ACOCL|nr:hypothetical protein QJS10_CPA01g02323 [Acorus calamus]
MGSLSPLQSPPRANPAATSASFRIYAAFYNKDPTNPSDFSSTWIQSYNPSDTWTGPRVPIPGLPHDQVLKDFSMVSLADHLYIIGGHLSPRRRPTPDSPDADLSVVVARVLRYSVNINEWSECAPMGTPRFSLVRGGLRPGDGFVGAAAEHGRGEVQVRRGDVAREVPRGGWVHVRGALLYRAELGGGVRAVARGGAWEVVPGMWQLDVPPNQIIRVGDDERLFSSGDCLNTWRRTIGR